MTEVYKVYRHIQLKINKLNLVDNYLCLQSSSPPPSPFFS